MQQGRTQEGPIQAPPGRLGAVASGNPSVVLGRGSPDVHHVRKMADFGWFWMILVSPMETFVWLIKNCQICLLTGFFTNQSSYAEPIHKGLWKFSFYLQAQGPGAVSEKTCMTQVCWELTLCFTWNTRRSSYQVGRCTKPEIPLGSSQVFSDQTHMLVLVICLFTYATYKLLIFDDMC
jgi:hypothetical protein